MTDPIEPLRRALAPAGRPVNAAEVAEAEKVVGSALPPLLVEVWLNVGAGGLIGSPHRLLRPSETAREYQRRRESSYGWNWPAGLLDIADLGCGIAACVDRYTTSVWWFDPTSMDRSPKAMPRPGGPKPRWMIGSSSSRAAVPSSPTGGYRRRPEISAA